MAAFIAGQENPWFMLGMYSRFAFGLMFALGYLARAWNLLALGRRATAAPVVHAVPAG